MAPMNPAEFLSDVPPTSEPSRPPRITKQELTTAHSLKMRNDYKPITALAGTCNYIKGQAEETAQTVYLLIDDHTEADAVVDPMLASAYQALTRAAQLLFEAQTHLYRYVNRLETERLAEEAYNTEMYAEHGNP